MTTASGGFPAGNLRVSDADRDRALAALSEHYQAGRLTPEEFDERSGQALQARTGQELSTLFADLPQDQAPWMGPSSVGGWSGPDLPAQTGRRTVGRRPAGASAPAARTVAIVAVLAVILVALAVGHNTGHPWGGLVVPLLLILLIVRRITRGRR
jgi:hypothetical protein